MTKQPSSEANEKNTQTESPAPEILRVQSDENDSTPDTTDNLAKTRLVARPRHLYRPSHKATFIGLGVVVAILLANAGIITYLILSQGKPDSAVSIGGVTINPSVLNTLGVSRNPVGTSGAELLVNPNARFNGNVLIGGDTSIAGQLKLNGKLLVTNASVAQLDAGKTALSEVNVNGDATASTLNLRKDLNVVGTSRLQGPVIISQLLTVNNSLTVAGNLSVGGVLSISGFQTNNLTIGGHIITRGSAPGISKGSALVDTDTVSNSGNDASGTVAVNIGSGSRSGIVVNLSFNSQYGNTPHVVVTAVGPGVSDIYVNRSANGFSIGVSSIVSGGHAFDYIVTQ